MPFVLKVESLNAANLRRHSTCTRREAYVNEASKIVSGHEPSQLNRSSDSAFSGSSEDKSCARVSEMEAEIKSLKVYSQGHIIILY